MAADREALHARLRALFAEELVENVVVLNRGLVALESGEHPDADAVVNEMFRAAHSLKGGAHSAGVPELVQLCHHLEDALARLRDRSLTPDTIVIEPLLAGVDALAAAAARMRDGGEAAGPDVTNAARRLVAALGPAADRAAGERAAAVVPTTSEPEQSVDVLTTSTATPADGLGEPSRTARDGTVRVSSYRLEAMLNEAGEMLHACTRVSALAEQLREAIVSARERAALTSAAPGAADDARAWRLMADRLDGLARSATDAGRVLTALSRGVAAGVQHARMMSLGQAFEGLERVVRDLAKAVDKDVRLEIRDGQVEVDRPILEASADAVLHMVRNAVDHGIETAEVRTAAGKEPVGKVSVVAALVPDGVAITVSDDGRGIDFDALRAAARRRGLTPPEDDSLLAELAFVPGVSTAPFITEVSGRGVGLDAVRARVEAVGGSVELRSAPGAGCTASIRLPLALSAVRVLLVGVGNEILALPSSSVSRLLRLDAADLRPLGGRLGTVVDDRAVPVLWLAEVIGFSSGERATPPFAGILTGSAPNEAILVVDDLLIEEEVVMKPVGVGLASTPGVLGASILSSGRVALVLNPATCVRKGLAGPSSAPLASIRPDASVRPRVLLAEDTITTRALERSILEAAGYDVRVAVDGLDAWQLLEEHGADIVVSDVDMPRMNGISLCEAARRSSRFRDIPFVLVTSLATDADRRRGVEAGANAYIVKGDFDQVLLLDTLERLL